MRGPASIEAVGALVVGAGTIACAACHSSPAPSPSCSPPEASTAEAPTDAGTLSIPITVVTVDDAGTQRLAVPLSINGSPPFLVTLDTGAVGLAVFASSLQGTAVTETSTALSTTFGGNAEEALTWSGVLARGVVQIGAAATPSAIAFQLVTAASCPSFAAGCSVTSAGNAGIGGNLGVSLRARGYPTPDVYSPIAQLAPPYSDGFAVRMGAGALVLGLPPDIAGFSTTSLSPDLPCALPNGLPAWEDSVEVCYAVNGAPLTPSCSQTFIDTGAEAALIWVEAAPSMTLGTPTGLMLNPGIAFEATSDAGLDLRFTSGPASPARVDFATGGKAVSALGRPVFAHYDVAFDIRHGGIGFQPAP